MVIENLVIVGSYSNSRNCAFPITITITITWFPYYHYYYDYFYLVSLLLLPLLLLCYCDESLSPHFDSDPDYDHSDQ